MMWLGYGLAFFIGLCVGIVIMAIVAAGAHADECALCAREHA